MKKYFTLLIALLSLTLLLSSCGSNEKRGVPDAIILRDAAALVSGSTRHEIHHGVDTDAHTDTLYLTTETDGQYGTLTVTAMYIYQYDKSSDLWTLLTEGHQFTEYALDENAYVSQSPWVGNEDYHAWGNGNYQYSIDIHQLSNSTIKYSYSIDFEAEDLPDIFHDDPITTTMSPHGDTLTFDIDLSDAGRSLEDSPLHVYLGIDGISTSCH